jgi:methyl-accepting chemotaxis protein
MKKKIKAVFVCAAVLSVTVLIAGCPKKNSGTQEIIDAAKNLGKTVEKNAPGVLKDLENSAKQAEKAAKKTAKIVDGAAKDAADAADTVKKVIKQAADN